MDLITKRRRFAPPAGAPPPTADEDTPTYAPYSSTSLLTSVSSASLLTVGARVRKSVTEGYKTHTTGFTPRPFMNTRLSPATLAAISGPTHFAELSPYAADLSGAADAATGGLPSQPLATVPFCGVGLEQLNRYSAGVTSLNHITSPPNARKRAFVDDLSDSEDQSPNDSDEMEDDSDAELLPHLPPAAFNFADFAPPAYNPHGGKGADAHAWQRGCHRRGSSYPFKHAAVPELTVLAAAAPARKMAAPRPRARGHPPPQQQMQTAAAAVEGSALGFTGFDNPFMNVPTLVAGGCGMSMMTREGNSDLREAAFLRARDEVEMDCS